MENGKLVVGFTGTQRGMTNEQSINVYELVKRLRPMMVHHGGCVGADISFDDICFRLKIECTIHPSNIKSKQGAWHNLTFLRDEHHPIERNHDIVDECFLLVATPKSKNEEVRSGTWATVRYAMCSGKTVIIVHNGGEIVMRGPVFWQLYEH